MGKDDDDDHGDENGANASYVARIAAWTVGHRSTSPNESCRSPIASRALDSPLATSLSRRVGELYRRSMQELTEIQIHDQCLCFFSARLRAFRKHLQLLPQANRRPPEEEISGWRAHEQEVLAARGP